MYINSLFYVNRKPGKAMNHSIRAKHSKSVGLLKITFPLIFIKDITNASPIPIRSGTVMFRHISIGKKQADKASNGLISKVRLF